MAESITFFDKILFAWNKRFGLFKFRLQRRIGTLGQVRIYPYLGFGNRDTIFIWGRVMEDRAIKPASDSDTIWDNLKAMYKRFISNEIPFVRVRARFLDAVAETITNEEGYFELKLKPSLDPPAHIAWHEVELELLDKVIRKQEPVYARGLVSIPPIHSRFGIISDLDDTVLETQATSLLTMLRLTLFNNSHTRVPFKGVAAFYQALQSGPVGSVYNPIFYVSSSPWNIYDMLYDFCNLHHIPKGTFMLRDLEFNVKKLFRSSHLNHKLMQIERVLAMYPHLRFILIGDSGQHDPEIYLQAIKDFPGRILAVYIRNVSSVKRQQSITAIAAQMKALGVEMLLVKNTEEAARHAALHNFIEKDSLPKIITDTAKDKQAPGALDQLMGTQPTISND